MKLLISILIVILLAQGWVLHSAHKTLESQRRKIEKQNDSIETLWGDIDDCYRSKQDRNN